MARAGSVNGQRSCPDCGGQLLDGLCDECGYDVEVNSDDFQDDDFDRDELGDDPEED